MFSGCVMPCSFEIAMSVMALLFKSVRLGVGKPIIVAAVVIMQGSLEPFLTDNMLKKQVEQNGKVGFCQKKIFICWFKFALQTHFFFKYKHYKLHLLYNCL